MKTLEERNKNYLNMYLPRIRAEIKRKFWMIGSFIFIWAFLKITLNFSLPAPSFFIMSFLLLFNSLSYVLFQKSKNIKAEMAIDWHFLAVFLDIIAMAAMIYYLGGIVWIAPFFYSFIVANLFWLFPRDKAFFLTGACLLSLVTLAGLQYLGALPDFYAFPWDPWEAHEMQSLAYVVVTATGSLLVILILGFSSDFFRRTLEGQIKEIRIAEKKLRETKELLEIEVKNKTADLAIEKKRLEQEITNRTKELEERHKAVQKRTKELEFSHQTAIEREIRMVEIKERISQLENKKNG